MKSLKGQFLVASPHLTDPNFVRSVVLLIEHTPKGAWGVVVNRPIAKTVQDLWAEVGSEPCESLRPVHVGGPVPGPLLSLHGDPLLAELDVLPGVFLSADRANLDKLVARADDAVKVFLGHSGWGPGQLERELDEGAWLIADATPELVLRGEHDLWQQTCKRIGQGLLKSSLGIKRLPPDPTVN